jgi:hypothetical protein
MVTFFVFQNNILISGLVGYHPVEKQNPGVRYSNRAAGSKAIFADGIKRNMRYAEVGAVVK